MPREQRWWPGLLVDQGGAPTRPTAGCRPQGSCSFGTNPPHSLQARFRRPRLTRGCPCQTFAPLRATSLALRTPPFCPQAHLMDWCP